MVSKSAAGFLLCLRMLGIGFNFQLVFDVTVACDIFGDGHNTGLLLSSLYWAAQNDLVVGGDDFDVLSRGRVVIGTTDECLTNCLGRFQIGWCTALVARSHCGAVAVPHILAAIVRVDHYSVRW